MLLAYWRDLLFTRVRRRDVLGSPYPEPLPALPEGKEFRWKLKSWLAEPVCSEPLTIIGSYRLF